ncbi:hypothetical protein QJS10_CPA10g00690 [Acorus calamus]|uniref:Vacuolar protein sorting-associated protein 13 VPS13 adaptor binding domain-containing protein n=1 Tax=Acorus calamus TaxID=4465 RepID=A0AAV9E234_ACOCL|nr:hypothetical protein QJS10_CPA10g00690 [Acorus calamus]
MLVLQHRAKRNVIKCDEYTLCLDDIDIHVFPKIFGSLKFFFERICVLGVPSSFDSVESSLGPCQETICKESINGIDLHNCVFSDFVDSESTMSTGISLDSFPFLTVQNCFGNLLSGTVLKQNVQCFRDNNLKKKAGAVNISMTRGPSNLEALNILATYNNIKSSVFKMTFNGIKVHFHDLSCIIGTVTLPASNLLLCFHKPDCWELLCSAVGVNISSSWSSLNAHECLWGAATLNVSPILNIRIRKNMVEDQYPLTEISFGIQYVCCILPADYLSILIGYFSLPDWKENHNQQSIENLQHENIEDLLCDVMYKFEILDSTLILPAENTMDYSMQVGLQELYFSFVPKCDSKDVFKDVPQECVIPAHRVPDMVHLLNVFGKNTSLSLLLIEKDDGQRILKLDNNDTKTIPLISELDAGLWLRIPYEQSSKNYGFPTLVMIKADVCNFIAEDNYFLLGLEATMGVVDQLSSIDMQSQYYRSDVLQFIQLKRILKESTASHDDSKESFMELRFYASALEIKLCHSNVNHHSNFSREVAKANMQISLSASLRNDVPRNMDLDTSGLVLYSFQNSVVLAACGDHTSSCLQINYLQSDQGTDEIVLAIPYLDIWLHLSDWEELIVFVKSCGHASSKTGFSSSESSKSYLRVKSKDLSVSFHLPMRMTGKDSGCQDNKGLPNNLPTNMEGKDTKRCMYLVVSLESRDIELILSSLCLKLKCMIEKTRAVLQITEVQNSISLPFFQTSQVSLGARVTEQQKDSYYIFSEVQVDTLDIGLSHQLINFWNGISFAISDRASSPIPLFHTSLKVSLRKASLLLSDGRWHSSDPILEILMRNIAAKASKMENVFECSILGDLLGSYNNFQKIMWEPFVEPWSFQLNLVRTQDQNVILSGPTVTDIHIQSAVQLNLNLTEPFLEAIFRGIEMIRDACHHGRANNIPDCEELLGRHTTSDISMKRYAPYILQNDTSLPLIFCVFRGPANIDNISTVKIESMVQPGCSVPIYIDEKSEEQMFQNRIAHSSENLSHKIASSVVHHMMSIQLDGTSFPSKPMSMDLVGLSYFEVDFSKPKSSDTDDVGQEENFSQVDSDDHFGRDSNKGFFVPVVFEVSMQRYRKLIRLYSTVVLLNETTMPLEIRFDIPFGVSSKILDPIYPGQEFPLPVHLAKSGRMTWRPLGGDYLWSEAHALSNILSHEHKLGYTRSFVCYPSHPSSDPFRCCISIQDYGLPSSCGPRMQKLDTSTKWFIRQVRLTTPLLVKNYLPVAISLTIESCGVMHSILLPELDSASIFHIDSNHDLGLTLHMHGFKPSVSKFSRAETFTATSKLNGSIFSLSETLTFYPDTSSNDPICVSLDKMVDAYCNAREICLYVPFLIYNCSGLSLAIAHGSHGKQGHTYIFPPSYHFLGQEQLLTTKNGLAIVSDQDTNVSTLNVDNLMNPLSQDPTISIRKNANLHFHRSQNQYFSDISRHSPRQFQIHVSENGEAPFEGPTGRGSTRSRLNLSGIVGSGSDRPDNEHGRKVKASIYSPIGSSPESELMVRLCAYFPECGMENNQNPAWSSPFYLIPPSGSNTVIIPRPHTTGAFVVSVTSSSLPGELTGRTRAISIQPRYIICNACNKDLCYKQKGSDYFYHLNIGEHSHIHWADTARELLISIRFNELGWQWSGSFLPDRLGDVLVKMRNYVSGAVNMVRVEVQNADVSITDDKIVGRSSGSLGTLLILLSDDNTGFMPYRIDNFSKENLRIFQQKCECSETIVHSYTSCNYVWDEPYYPHRLIVEVPGERVLGSFCLDDVREFVPVLLPSISEKPERKFFLSIYAEGATKVLSIIDSGYHNVEDIKQTRFLRIRGQRECDQESRFDFTERIIVHASLIGVSLINSSPQELIFACAKGTTIELMQSSDQQKISLEILSLQIDNQLYDTTFPTLLSFEHLYRHSTQLKQNKEADSKIKNENVSPIVSEFSHEPVIHLSAARWRNVDCSLVSFEYIKFRLSPLRIEIEEQILLSLIDYIKTLVSRLQSTNMPNQSWVDGGFGECFQLVQTYERSRDINTVKPCSLKVSQFTDNHKIMESLPSIVPIGAPWQKLFLLARRQKKIYVEAFDLASIKLTISFSSDPWVTKKDDREDAESLIRASSSAFQRGLMALIDIEGVPVYLRELTLMHLMASQESIQDMIVRHYTRQLRNEIYKVFGSAGVFGNPMGFARNVGVGIKDFLSASSKSIVQSPAELVTGVAQGSKSLVSNTVYAISSAATQFSKAAHKGIVAFTFDQQAVRQNSPHSHGKGVLDEFLEGLTGLLQSPIKGAEKHGLPGVFSGIALGTAGLVARPMASILEVTGKTAQSIRNRSSPHQARCLRMRFPRPLARDLPLLPYSWEEAIGTYMLLEADNAKYRNEIFIMCKALKHPGKFVVVTTKLVLVFRSSSLVGFHSPEFCGIANPEWVIEVEIGLETVIHIDREQEIVNIIGSNVVSPSKQNQQKRTSSSRMSQWTSPTTMPICQMSLEFSSMEEAEDTFQVVWSTLQRGKERGWESYVLHRHHQKR